MIQYDDDLVAGQAASPEAGDTVRSGGSASGLDGPWVSGGTGVTRFDLAEPDDSLQSSMVDLDLNLLPLDAKVCSLQDLYYAATFYKCIKWGLIFKFLMHSI